MSDFIKKAKSSTTLRVSVCLLLFSLPTPSFSEAPCETLYQTLPDHLEKREEIEARYAALDSIDDITVREAARFDAQVKVVADPQEGLLAKILIIRQAKHTIDIGTYIFRQDRVGYTLLAEVKKAIERGVDVRILVDSQGSLHPTQAALKSLLSVKPGATLDAAGKRTTRLAKVEVKLFNPLVSPTSTARNWYFRLKSIFFRSKDSPSDAAVWRNRRMHDKIVAADIDYPDDAVVIIGGRNLSEAYYGMPERTPDTYNDMELMVRNIPGAAENPVADRLGRQYDRVFYHLGNKYLSRLLFSDFNPRLETQFERMGNAENIVIAPGSDVEKKLMSMAEGNYLAEGFDTSKNLFTHEADNISRRNAFKSPEKNSGTKTNFASVLYKARNFIRKATQSIDIVTPYLYLNDEELAFLHGWLKEDPARKLRIVTNSVSTGDNMMAQAMIDKLIAPRFVTDPMFEDVRSQVEFFQFGKLDGTIYGGTEFYGKLHAKFMVIDGKYSFVTSFNGDPRSRYLNSEIGVISDSAEAAKVLLGKVNEFVSKSYRWGSEDWKKLVAHPKNRLKILQENVLKRFISVALPMI